MGISEERSACFVNDPMGNALKYEIKGKRFVVISAGSDGDFGTEDDIRSDKKGSSKSGN